MLALFDMDGTLVRENTAALYVKYEYEMRRISAWKLARVLWWRARYFSGHLDAEELAERALGWYVGRSIEELQAEMASWFERYVSQHITARAKQRVEEHRRAGDVLAVVTGAAPYATVHLAELLRIHQIVCSEVEVVDGRITGKLVRPGCFGIGKLQRTRNWLRESYPELSLERATFYTDSITDLPLLEAVGNPVAVNPDPRLRRLATLRGWVIEYW